MIPVSLTIEGLYSYRQRQRVDFSRLTAAQVFGIFGPTGSGKSSLLEAMAFALYGETERLNKQESRGYNMMNLGSDRLYIDFTFESGDASGQHEGMNLYRFVVQGKRNSKRREDVGTLERTAYRIVNEELIPIDEKTAEPILGLSYDNFKRTIIIPQGKFQEFLTLTDTDRTRMLREIFSLQRFELADKVRTLHQQNEARLGETRALLHRFDDVTEARIAEAKTALAELTAQADARLRTRDALSQQIQQIQALRLLFDQQEAQQRETSQLIEQQPAVEARARLLDRYQEALATFKPLLDRRTEKEHEQKNLARNLREDRAGLERNQKELEEAEAVFRNAEKTFLQREQFKERVRDWDNWLAIRERDEKIQAQEQRLTKGQEVLAKEKAQRESLATELLQLETQLAETGKDLPDLAELMEADAWFSRTESLEAAVKQAGNQVETIEKEQRAEAERVQKLARTLPLEPDQQQLAPAALLPLTQAMIADAGAKIAALQAHLHHAGVAEKLTAYARELKPGDPCPLCGSDHHPNPVSGAPTGQAKQLAADLQQAESQLAVLRNAAAGLATADETRQRTAARLAEAREALGKAEGELHAHLPAFGGSPGLIREDRSRISQWLAGHKQAEEAKATLERRKRQVREQQEKITVTLERYQAEFQKIQGEIQALRGDVQARTQGLIHIRAQEAAPLSADQLRKQREIDQNAYGNVSEFYETAKQKRDSLAEGIATLKGRVATLTENEQQATAQLARIAQEIQAALKNSPFAALPEAEALLAEPINVPEERRKIEGFRERLSAARERLVQLQAQLSGKSFDPDAFTRLSQQLAEATESYELLNREVGAKQGEIGRLTEEMEEKTLLLMRQQELTLRADDLGVLRSLFNRSGFVDYVSGMYLQHVCASANERFRKLTRGQLSLEVSADNSLQVRDFLHDGQVRSVKTLSGGQIFQAALSLALALSDNIHRRVHSDRSFFFIDEGFGSLDGDSLALIFDTLKALRRENRIVGIISHVSALQQEMDACLLISQDARQGSLVKGSWE